MYEVKPEANLNVEMLRFDAVHKESEALLPHRVFR